MNFLFAIVSSLNRFQKSRRLFGWFVYLLVLLQSVIAWVTQKEFRSFADCYFHYKKQSKHPWIHERSIEYPWIAKNISEIKNCCVLDVGAKEGLPSSDILLNNNNVVFTIDINASNSIQSNNRLIIKNGDICSTPFNNEFFDAVIAVSTLEHIGILGRYGIDQPDQEGDISAMVEIFRILKPGGKVFITLPYGVGKSLPLNRLYNVDRVNRLFEKYTNIKKEYFKFDSKYAMWFEVPESTAAENNWDVDPWYSIACCSAEKSNRNDEFQNPTMEKSIYK